MPRKIGYMNGYRLVYMPEHPKSLHGSGWEGFVYEHVLVAEKFMKRPLREEEVVHHLNRNKGDNRKANLLVLESSQHGKLHGWIDRGAPGVASLETVEPRFCSVCGKTIQREESKSHCSKNCRAIARRGQKPTKEQLEADIRRIPFTKIGKKYGVSDNAIRKWAAQYGIQ